MESVVFYMVFGGLFYDKYSIRMAFYDAPKNLKRLFIRNNSIKNQYQRVEPHATPKKLIGIFVRTRTT